MNSEATTSLRTPPTQFGLSRNAFGKLVLTTREGQEFVGVMPVRAFPIQLAEQCIAMVDADGHELAWINDLSEVPQAAQDLIREALETREFIPEIKAILSVTSFSTPCTWEVRTDRGDTRFVLRGDEDIRRLGETTLLVTDSHGIHFLIRDITALSRNSRKILDRFK
jgi:hypothetical protein